MDTENYFFRMVVIIQDNSKMIRLRGWVDFITQMEIIIKGSFRIMWRMDMDSIFQLLAESIKGIGNQINDMELERRCGLMGLLSKENTNEIKNVVMEHLSTSMEIPM